jgi:hypothetical protein
MARRSALVSEIDNLSIMDGSIQALCAAHGTVFELTGRRSAIASFSINVESTQPIRGMAQPSAPVVQSTGESPKPGSWRS